MYATKKKIDMKFDGGYITIGDPYEKRENKNERFLGKQFKTNPPQKGEPGYFSKFIYQPSNYKPDNQYRETQPLDSRRKGFGSGDASRRDEFTLDVRVQQYRELISTEKEFVNRWGLQAAKRAELRKKKGIPSVKANSAKKPVKNVSAPKRHLYDMVRPNLVNSETPECLKCSRNTFHCIHNTSRPRVTGWAKTVAMEIGEGVEHISPRPNITMKRSTKEFYGLCFVIKSLYVTFVMFYVCRYWSLINKNCW